MKKEILKECKNLIEKYYLKDILNLNNDINNNSYKLKEKIIDLRKNISKHFAIKDWERIIFFPNDFYAQQTIIYSLDIDKNWEIYSDEKKTFLDNKEYVKDINFFNLKKSLQERNNKKILLWITKEKNFLKLWKYLEKNKKTKNLKIFLKTKRFLNPDIWKIISWNIDFLVFNPSKILNLHGISILCVNQNEKLIPKYLGSNSVSNLSFRNFSLKKNYETFECGTQNFVILLIMQKIFESTP